LRSYLIVGQTGVGKSSFINAVLGTEAAEPSPFKAGTKVVKYFTYTTPFGEVNLIDTPGLGEGTIDLDRAYLSLVREAIALHSIDVLIYVTSLDDTRFRPGEKRALQLITQQIGSSIWQNSWLLLTNAALVPQERFEETVKERFVQICLFLQEIIGALDVKNSQFESFQKVLVIDNLTSGWHNNALPVTSIFESQ
jgi:predicted GTPase